MKAKINLLLGALLLTTLFSACNPTYRVVEDPIYECASCDLFDFRRIELTDSATIINLDVCFTPKYWIKFDKNLTLMVGDKRYKILSIEGATMGELFWMPESGKASFKLTFEPLPINTKSFDFGEEDDPEGWIVRGIDLTGRKKFQQFHPDLPKHLRKRSEVAYTDPEYSYTVGKSKVNLHLLGDYDDKPKSTNLITCSVIGVDVHPVEFDPQSDIASCEFMLYGTSTITFRIPVKQYWDATFTLAPNEEVDVYIDLRAIAQYAVHKNRGTEFDPIPLITTNSSKLYDRYNNSMLYDRYNNEYNYVSYKEYNGEYYLSHMQLSELIDYRNSSEQNAEIIYNKYLELKNGLEADNRLSAYMKLRLKNHLDQNLILVSDMYSEFIIARNYGVKHGLDIFQLNETPKELEEVLQRSTLGKDLHPKLNKEIDLKSDHYLIDWQIQINRRTWSELGVDENNIYAQISLGKEFIQDAESGNLEKEAIKRRFDEKVTNPFVREILLTKNRITVEKLKEVETRVRIEKNPDVKKEKFLDAVLAPHKGKVVVIDFWNTWCGPCLEAHKEIGPLKENELNHEDMVWIYFANHSSPEGTYKIIIDKIKGLHYYLDISQWDYLCEKFGITGIPSYVVVDRKGNISLRDDLIDIGVMKQELTRLLNEK